MIDMTVRKGAQVLVTLPSGNQEPATLIANSTGAFVTVRFRGFRDTNLVHRTRVSTERVGK